MASFSYKQVCQEKISAHIMLIHRSQGSHSKQLPQLFTHSGTPQNQGLGKSLFLGGFFGEFSGSFSNNDQWLMYPPSKPSKPLEYQSVHEYLWLWKRQEPELWLQKWALGGLHAAKLSFAVLLYVLYSTVVLNFRMCVWFMFGKVFPRKSFFSWGESQATNLSES